MNKIFVRLLCALIPNKSKRKTIRRVLLGKEYDNIVKSNIPVIGDVCLSDSVKAKCICEDLLQKKETVKIMVLGSSHAQMSFIDSEDSINFGNGSLDLYYQWKIYKKFHNYFHNLKYLVLFYDIFSSGNDMQKGPFHRRTALYHLLYNIPYKDKKLATKLGTFDFEKKMISDYFPIATELSKTIDHTYPIVCSPSPKYTYEQLKEFAKGQIKLNKKGNMHVYLEKILQLSRKKGYQVLIAVSPYREDFRRLFPHKHEIFSNLEKIAKKYSVLILNLYDDPDFVDGDFRNPDHLNKKGAIKMTLKIREEIK